MQISERLFNAFTPEQKDALQTLETSKVEDRANNLVNFINLMLGESAAEVSVTPIEQASDMPASLKMSA